MKLDEHEIAEHLKQLSNWSLDAKTISRRYKFASFPNAIEFVNDVAQIAERRDHHPFISIDYKTVTLKLTSWHAGGLTEQDFVEASEFDALYEGLNGSV